ncbi:8-amino-7-oxononanoate synthase [Chryseolinea sp. T2]|uniref:aminotransferase class I/II-fold pyridoxal phosphate-dependent enzyme n=1 Tax=Chryseolinea sp. T2 TaxID=3129255 RepID=UPI003078354D
MIASLLDRLQSELRQLDTTGLQRRLSTNNLIDFTSNDYLGLAHSRELFDMVNAQMRGFHDRYNGATGSRLLSGNSALAEDVESQLAIIFQSESVLLFNSGYSANLGVLSSLAHRNDTIIYDEYAHASIKDGARLSLARRLSFRHNDLDDLENKLKQSTNGQAFIVVESIYSMDGDRCPLVELVALAEKANATIILDEAHSTGLEGNNGGGMALSLGLADKVGVRIHTFGKAMGCHGACVAGPQVLKQYLINTSRPFIYTTALPPHNLITLSCAFRFLQSHPELIQRLTNNIKCFTNSMSATAAFVPTGTAIQRVVIPGNDRVSQVAATLRGKGFDVRPIRRPTVPAGSERIRICLHAFNREEDIRALAGELNKVEY